jgi:3-hydroxyacyl-[acyl-carrier-protein] dehydratase
MTFEVHRAITAEHPSLPGHFPDAPLVAGALILDEVLAALSDWHKECRLTAIPRVKFLRPLKPGQSFAIHFSASDDDAAEVNFCCRIEDRIIVEGRFELCAETRVSS